MIFWNNASENLFYLNSFIDNARNVEEYYPGLPEFPINIWDNGTVGNFWSDYYGADNNGDGIGDTPYVIDENNQDNYPLMHYWGSPTQHSEPFPTTLLVSTIVIIAIGGVAVLVYFIKIRKPTEVEKIQEGVK